MTKGARAWSHRTTRHGKRTRKSVRVLLADGPLRDVGATGVPGEVESSEGSSAQMSLQEGRGSAEAHTEELEGAADQPSQGAESSDMSSATW